MQERRHREATQVPAGNSTKPTAVTPADKLTGGLSAAVVAGIAVNVVQIQVT